MKFAALRIDRFRCFWYHTRNTELTFCVTGGKRYMKILLNQMQVFRMGKTGICSILVEDGRIVSLSKEAPTISDAFSIELKNGT